MCSVPVLCPCSVAMFCTRVSYTPSLLILCARVVCPCAVPCFVPCFVHLFYARVIHLYSILTFCPHFLYPRHCLSTCDLYLCSIIHVSYLYCIPMLCPHVIYLHSPAMFYVSVVHPCSVPMLCSSSQLCHFLNRGSLS